MFSFFDPQTVGVNITNALLGLMTLGGIAIVVVPVLMELRERLITRLVSKMDASRCETRHHTPVAG